MSFFSSMFSIPMWRKVEDVDVGLDYTEITKQLIGSFVHHRFSLLSH